MKHTIIELFYVIDPFEEQQNVLNNYFVVNPQFFNYFVTINILLHLFRSVTDLTFD